MPYQVDSPLSAALSAASGYLAGRQAQQQRAYEQARQNAQEEQQRQQAAAQLALAKSSAESTNAYRTSELNLQNRQAAAGEERNRISQQQADTASATEVFRAKQEADNALHQAAVDALNAAKEQFLEDKDLRAYMLAQKRIKDTHDLAVARLKNERDMAQIRANAVTGSAGIHAAATVEAAGIHTEAQKRGQDVQKRGQDLAHQDRQKAIISKPAPGAATFATNKAREEDHAKAASVIEQGGDREGTVRYFAAKWRIPYDQASKLFP